MGDNIMVYELPKQSFLKNIAYVRQCISEKYPRKNYGDHSLVDDYNSEIRLAGNSIVKIQEVLDKYLKILNEDNTLKSSTKNKRKNK